MFYSLFVVAVIASLLFAMKYWQNLPEARRKEGAFKMLLWGTVALVLVLVFAGRAHWLMGVLAALLALAGRAAQLAQYVPLFQKIFGQYQSQKGGHSGAPSLAMSPKEAAELLGVNENASVEEVRLAHKKLMQKIHPDRGGTDALARQINAAKDILLG